MKINELYKEGVSRLQKAGVPDAKIDAFRLLESVSGIDHAFFMAEPGRELSDDIVRSYRAIIERRSQRIPLQHILGEQEFMGLSFLVNEHVLIPRSDTETLVEHVLDEICSSGKEEISILDLGCGSGCILISLLSFLEKQMPSDFRMKACGLDISEKALEMAKKNACRLIPGRQVTWIRSDLFREIAGERFDMILSNPPYIPSGEIAELEAEVREHDPMTALCGGEDGLDFYRRICAEAPRHLTERGQLVFEIGYGQAEAVKDLMEEADFSDLKIIRDLGKIERVISGQLNTFVV